MIHLGGMNMSNHVHLIDLVRKLMNAEGTEDELDDMLNELEQELPYTEISNLIFWDDRDLTPEQIVEEALAARPIILPPQP
ncbi:bacteriocin immunity protein [Paenibacillus sp. JNUCC31]|nr:bacteriocin immunity protein [Paenibacillus sp. JNUCC-31]